MMAAQPSAYGTPSKVTIAKRSMDFGSSKQSFATLEDQQLALNMGTEEWEQHKGGNIERSGQVKGDRVVAKHTTLEEQTKILVDAQARKAEMDAISAEDADLVARLLAMDKLELEQSQAQAQALAEGDAALARGAAEEMAAELRAGEDVAARDARIAAALQQAERDRANGKTHDMNADAVLARQLSEMDAATVAAREAQAAADAALAAKIQKEGSPLKVIPPPPRGSAAAAEEGVELATKLLASTSINAEQFIADQKKALEVLKSSRGGGGGGDSGGEVVANNDDDDDDDESDTDGEVDL